MVVARIASPASRLAAPPAMKARIARSWKYSAAPIGSRNRTANSTSTEPSRWTTPASERIGAGLALALEQALDGVDVTVVGQEHDQVVFAFDDGVVVRHDDLLAAHQRDDAGPFRQLDLADAPADHARAIGTAV